MSKQTTVNKPAEKTAKKNPPPAAKDVKAAGKTAEKPAAKAAAKPEVKKPEAKAKPAAKPTVALVTRMATKGQTLHVLSDSARPAAGRALFAHTHAALTVTGMLNPQRPAVPRNLVTTVLGQRAVNYHVAQGNFETTADHGIRLSATGYSGFRERADSGKVDAALANDFQGMLLDGEPGKTGVAKGNLFVYKP